MRATRIVALVTLTSVLLISLATSAAPGAGRLPHDDYQELLRYQILGPEVEAPEQEYTILTTVPIGEEERAALAQVGITVDAVVGTTAQVRGPLTAFDGLGPGQDAFPWIRVIWPAIPLGTSQMTGPTPIGDVRAAMDVDQVHEKAITGEGITVGIIDPQFTGRMETDERVQYVKVNWEDGPPTIVEGVHDYAWLLDLLGLVHGEQCAEGVRAVAPDANLVLMSTGSDLDREYYLSQIAAGNIEIDVLSDSTFWPFPQDHGDGRGELAQLGDAVVESGVFYAYAIGNFGLRGPTDRSFYSATWLDSEGDRYHDFTPDADDYLERNTLALTMHPWGAREHVTLWVILAWDGWEYQVRDPGQLGIESRWSREEYIAVQDLDLHLWYQEDGRRPVRVRSQVVNQLEYAYDHLVGEKPGEYRMPPVEVLEMRVTQPGRYLIQVENTTIKHAFPEVFERDVELRIYVQSNSPGGFTMEQHTLEGSFLNMGGAQHVTAVGAVERPGGNWQLASYSSQGPSSDVRLKPEMVTPSYYECDVGSRGHFRGTSASAPLVAGLAALLLEANPRLSPLEVRSILSETATPLCGKAVPGGRCGPGAPNPDLCVEWSYAVGCGLPNALAAVERALAEE